jgi:glyoxylase-like metal-dependent hydrolase (beta-lactamase superfamily II)
MAAKEILDNLFFIQRGYLNGNHFVYRSDEPVLIDTAYVADFEETERLISSLGVAIPAVRLIISTHCHCDHIGGNKIIQDRSRCDVALHRIGKHFIDARNDWATWWRYYNQEADFFECDTPLDDGDTISLGPHEFRVIYTPGHAADGIVLYNAKERVLISSDTLWESDMAVISERVEGSRACFSMLESMDKIGQLDVKMAYPGHGKPFTEEAGAVERTRRRLEGFLQNPQNIGNDLLKKIIIYTLMMLRKADEDSFFDHLMRTIWFREAVDLYFDGDYSTKYHQIMNDFLHRGIVKITNGTLYTTVTP